MLYRLWLLWLCTRGVSNDLNRTTRHAAQFERDMQAEAQRHEKRVLRGASAGEPRLPLRAVRWL